MQTDNRLRTTGHGRDFIEIQGRGVGGEDSPRFGNTIQAGEDVFLHRHVLEYRLDDQITVSQLGQLQRSVDQRTTLLNICLADAALACGISHSSCE